MKKVTKKGGDSPLNKVVLQESKTVLQESIETASFKHAELEYDNESHKVSSHDRGMMK